MALTTKMNPDIENERKNSNLNVENMKQFLGSILYGSQNDYKELMKYSRFQLKKNNTCLK
jgi:hypothetical protein